MTSEDTTNKLELILKETVDENLKIVAENMLNFIKTTDKYVNEELHKNSMSEIVINEIYKNRNKYIDDFNNKYGNIVFINKNYTDEDPGYELVSIGKINIPKYNLSAFNSFGSCCAIHAMMSLLMSVDLRMTFFKFNNNEHLRQFIQAFAKMNNNELGTGRSELHDVLRSFCDIICQFLPLESLYPIVSTRKNYDFNMCDIKKIRKISDKLFNNSKEYIIEDLRHFQPDYILFDMGMWSYVVDDNISKMLTVSQDLHYMLFGLVEDLGGHYIANIIDNKHIKDRPFIPLNMPWGQNWSHAFVYDDLRPPNSITLRKIETMKQERIAALLYFKMDDRVLP